MEAELSDYISKAAHLAYGLRYKDCCKLAYQLAVANDIPRPPSWDRNEQAGKDWMIAFMKRHPLSLRKPESCSYARNISFNKHNVGLFFDNLEAILTRDTKLADPCRIFNLDETGTTTHLTPERVVAPTGVRGIQQANSDERGTTVTTCSIISAAGTFLPPVMVFPRKNVIPQMTEGAAPGTLALANSSGWMNTEAFSQVLDHFILKTGSTPENPTLLILYNYSSHIDISNLQKAKQNGVPMLTIPPHSSHKIQPLDVAVFRPFNQYYNEAMRNYMLSKPNVRVTIYQIASFVDYAYKHAMKPATIQNAFKATGIYPFDRNVFSDDDFRAAEVSERPDSTLDSVNEHRPSSGAVQPLQIPFQATGSDRPTPTEPPIEHQEPSTDGTAPELIPRQEIAEKPNDSESSVAPTACDAQETEAEAAAPGTSSVVESTTLHSTADIATDSAAHPKDARENTSVLTTRSAMPPVTPSVSANVASTSGSQSKAQKSTVSPIDLRPLPQAQRAVTKQNNPRKKGKSMIATDTPNMKEIGSKKVKGKSKQNTGKRKQPAKKAPAAKKRLVQREASDESSEEDEMPEREFQRLLGDDTDEEYDEEDNDEQEICIIDVSGEFNFYFGNQYVILRMNG